MLRHAMTVGRITAIPIKLHWSWLVVLVLVVVMLSQVYAGYVGGAMPWVMAVIATLLLRISVGLHELGHAGVGRRYQLSVRRTTPFAPRGGAEIDGTRPDPLQEL